jgi:hypothetical protein
MIRITYVLLLWSEFIYDYCHLLRKCTSRPVLFIWTVLCAGRQRISVHVTRSQPSAWMSHRPGSTASAVDVLLFWNHHEATLQRPLLYSAVDVAVSWVWLAVSLVFLFRRGEKLYVVRVCLVLHYYWVFGIVCLEEYELAVWDVCSLLLFQFSFNIMRG